MTYELSGRCKNRSTCEHIVDPRYSNIGEFCCNFYHVRKYNIPRQASGEHDETKLKCPWLCLEPEVCLLGRRALASQNRKIGPKYAFAIASLNCGETKYCRKYSNCYKERVTKHAEEFLCEDAYEGELCEAISSCCLQRDMVEEMGRESREVVKEMGRGMGKERREMVEEKGRERREMVEGMGREMGKERREMVEEMARERREMVVYITIQPCHESKLLSETAGKSCTNKLIQLYNEVLKPNGIRLIIKVAFLHKAHWFIPNDSATAMEVENAKNGIRLLHSAGVQVYSMEKQDWKDLIRIGQVSLNIDEIYHRNGTRFMMDRFIATFLENIKQR